MDSKHVDWSEEVEDAPVDIEFDSDGVSEPDEEEFIRKENKYPPTLDECVDMYVIVDGLPIAEGKKIEKLRIVLETKVFKKLGISCVSLELVVQDDKTVGYGFLEFESVEKAADAVEKLNGYALDKQHTFYASSLGDIDKYADVPDEVTLPEKGEYVDKGNLLFWMLDPKARQQYVRRVAETAEVFYNDIQSTEPIYSATVNATTDSIVEWSSQGTYLASVHSLGIRLWGGPELSEIQRFAHKDVRLVQFSPQENFLVTFSNSSPQLIIWDTRTGKLMRQFDEIQTSGQWPFLRWSPDDKYFAHAATDLLYVFETSTFKAIQNHEGQRKPLSFPGIMECDFSPKKNVIAFWQPEQNNKPARVTLMELPSLKDIRYKNLFNVDKCNLHWHPDGTYLAVKVDRLTKTKKFSHTEFELFCCEDKGIPVDMVEIKEPVTTFGWESKGNHCTVIHGSSASSQNVTIYEVRKSKFEKVATLDKRPVNRVYWSPRGEFMLLAQLGKGANGTLEFYHVKSGAEPVLLGSAEHFAATTVAWDPSGRFVATSVSAWTQNMETGYRIHSFAGKRIHTVTLEKFYQLIWRPVPASLLTEEEMKYAKSQLKKTWAKEFDAEDQVFRDEQSLQEDKVRQAAFKRYKEIIKKRNEEFKAEAQKRRELRGGDLSDDEGDYETQLVKETIVLSRKEEVVA